MSNPLAERMTELIASNEEIVRSDPKNTILGSRPAWNPGRQLEGKAIAYLNLYDKPWKMITGEEAVAGFTKRTVWSDGSSQVESHVLSREDCIKLWEVLAKEFALDHCQITRPAEFLHWDSLADWGKAVSEAYVARDSAGLDRLIYDFAKAFKGISENTEYSPSGFGEEMFQEDSAELTGKHSVDLSYLPPLEAGDVLTITFDTFGGVAPSTTAEIRLEKFRPE